MNIPIDPNMAREPCANPYFLSDDWDKQVAKWVEYKQQKAARKSFRNRVGLVAQSGHIAMAQPVAAHHARPHELAQVVLAARLHAGA